MLKKITTLLIIVLFTITTHYLFAQAYVQCISTSFSHECDKNGILVNWTSPYPYNTVKYCTTYYDTLKDQILGPLNWQSHYSNGAGSKSAVISLTWPPPNIISNYKPTFIFYVRGVSKTTSPNNTCNSVARIIKQGICSGSKAYIGNNLDPGGVDPYPGYIQADEIDIQEPNSVDFPACITFPNGCAGKTASSFGTSSFRGPSNYPNPFTEQTTIEYNLIKQATVSIQIFDLKGQLVANLIDNEQKNIGKYKQQWNTSNLASGIYYYQLRIDNVSYTNKMVKL